MVTFGTWLRVVLIVDQTRELFLYLLLIVSSHCADAKLLPTLLFEKTKDWQILNPSAHQRSLLLGWLCSTWSLRDPGHCFHFIASPSQGYQFHPCGGVEPLPSSCVSPWCVEGQWFFFFFKASDTEEACITFIHILQSKILFRKIEHIISQY